MDSLAAKIKVTNENKKECNKIENFKLPLNVVSIGVVESIFNKKNGTPRQSGICPQSKGIIRLHKDLFNNPLHALEGIEQFEYLWIIFYFHQNENYRRFKAKVRPPRLDGDSCGVLASRSPHRPNPFGLTIVKLDFVKDGCLHISGLDMVDQTPIIDIKPYIEKYDNPYFSSISNLSILKSSMTNENENCNDILEEKNNDMEKECRIRDGWIDGSLVNEIEVNFTARSLKQLTKFHLKTEFHRKNENISALDCEYCFRLFRSEAELKDAIINLLKADPRSVYRRNKCVDRLYYFTIDAIHITAWFDIETNIVEVIKIKPYRPS